MTDKLEDRQDTAYAMWVVLRRSRHPNALDHVTVAYSGYDRDEAEAWMAEALSVQQTWKPKFPSLYELAEC